MSQHGMIKRELGFCEKLAYILEEKGSCNFCFFLKTDKIIISYFEEAIDLAISQHQLLNCKISIEKNSLFFESIGKHQSIIEDFYNKNSASQDIILALNKKFDFHKGEFFNVQCFHGNNDSEIIFSFCHIIADATAGICLINDIFSFYSALIDGIKPRLTSYLLKEPVEKLLFRSRAKSKNVALKHSASKVINKNSNLDIQTIEIPISYLTTQETHKNTIHQKMLIASFQAMREKVKEKSISLVTPVNIREKLDSGILPQDFGYYLSRMDICFAPEVQNDYSVLTSKIQEEYDFQLNKNYIKSTIQMLEKFSGFELHTESNMASSNNPMILISNIGKIENHIKKHHNFNIKDVRYFIAPQTIPQNINNYCLAVSTYNNIISISLCYDANINGNHDAICFLSRIKYFLASKAETTG